MLFLLHYRAVLFFGVVRRFGHHFVGLFLLEGRQFAGGAELRARGEDDARGLDLGDVEIVFRQAARRTQGEAKVADFAELDDTPGAEVLVKAIVHAVEHGLDVGGGQRTGFGNLGAKLVEGHIAVIDRLGVELARVILGILAQVPPLNQLVLLCHC